MKSQRPKTTTWQAEDARWFSGFRARVIAREFAMRASRQLRESGKNIGFAARKAGGAWKSAAHAPTPQAYVDLRRWPADVAFGPWFAEMVARHNIRVLD